MKRFMRTGEFCSAQLTMIDSDINKKGIESEALARSIKTQFEEYVTLNPKLSPCCVGPAILYNHCGWKQHRIFPPIRGSCVADSNC